MKKGKLTLVAALSITTENLLHMKRQTSISLYPPAEMSLM